jgi:phosphomannomutase
MAGCRVTDVGLGPTPYVYFCGVAQKADGVIMITGSHCEPNVNGFKLVQGGKPFFGQQIQDLYKTTLIDLPMGALGLVESKDLTDTYIEFLKQDFLSHYPSHSGLKIAWDPGNGAAGNVLSRLLKQLPGTHVVINADIDGTFPNHHPDPTVPENLDQVLAVVKDQSCDFAIAFDGDADRIGVITSNGDILWGEHLLELYAEEVLKTHPGASIVADVKTSTHFFKHVEALGGKPVMWRTGHSLIKTKMRELKSPLGGEMSGHIFFADRYYGFDDALYAALRLVGIVLQEEINLTHWFERRSKVYCTPEIRLPCVQKFDVIAALKKVMQDEGVPYNDLDGIRCDLAHGWWVLRASNTQEIIAARAEADAPVQLDILLTQMQELLSKAGFDVLDLHQHAGHKQVS